MQARKLQSRILRDLSCGENLRWRSLAAAISPPSCNKANKKAKYRKSCYRIFNEYLNSQVLIYFDWHRINPDVQGD